MKSKKFIALVLGMSMAIGSSPAVVFAEELPESGTAVTEEDLPENGEASEEEADEVTQDEITVDEIVSVESANSDRVIYYGKLDQNGDVYWDLYDSGELEIYGSGDIYDYDVSGDNVPGWMAYKDRITSVVISKDSLISRIGENAFYGCTNITSVSIARSVKFIGAQAFKDCSSLNTVTLDDIYYSNLTGIGHGAFENCSALAYYDFNSDLQIIAYNAFRNCTSLTVFEFNNYSNLTDINETAFAGCTNLTSVDLSLCNNLFSLSSGAFYSCTMLTSVLLPNSLKIIDNRVFADCYALSSITIPQKVTRIGESAFAGCNSIKHIYCCPRPENLTWENYQAIHSVEKIELHVVDKVSYEAKFGDFDALITDFPCGDDASCYLDPVKNYLYIDGRGLMYDFIIDPSKGIDTRPWAAYIKDIKSVIITDGIEHIGNNSFRDATNLETANIPASVVVIGESAFYYCENLEAVNFGTEPKLEIIEKSAFGDCVNLKIMPFAQLTCLKKIGYAAFQLNRGLSSIEIQANVEVIDDFAFADCDKVNVITFYDLTNEVVIGQSAFRSTGIKWLEVPANVVGIRDYAFSFCCNLQTVKFAENSKLDYIGKEAFYYCEDLTKVEIPASVTEIGDCAFLECPDLEDVIIPENSKLQTIGAAAFQNDKKLYRITIPATVTSIGNSAFADCEKLTAVDFEAGSNLMTIGYSAFYDNRIENIIIPKSVTEIGYQAFAECRYLESVKFEKGSLVTSIDYATFNNCESLNTVILPDGLIRIENNAFRYCSALELITIPSGITQLGSTAFLGCFNLTDVYLYADPANLEWYGDDDSFMRDHGTLCHVYADKRDEFKDKFTDVNVDFIPDLIGMNAGVVLAGHSLTLDGAVGVNFFMELSDEVLSADNPYMLFTLPNGTTQKVYVKTDADFSGMAIPGKDFYVFQCRVSAKQMTDEITAQIYLNDNVPVEGTYTYSVRDYANYIINHPSSYKEEVVTLVKKMLNYGAYSQQYFNYNTDNLANTLLTNNDKRVNDIPTDVLNGYKYMGNTMIGNTSIRFASVNIELESEIVLNLYFENVPDGVVFKLDGTDVLTPTKSGNYTVVSIKNISAKNLTKFYSVVLYSGEEALGYVSYSPMNYCYNVVTRETTQTRTEELKTLIKTLYWFYDAAKWL